MLFSPNEFENRSVLGSESTNGTEPLAFSGFVYHLKVWAMKKSTALIQIVARKGVEMFLGL
jgi:hypothetical protein